MLIHVFLTDGFLDWARLFLESFKYHNGENYWIVFTTRDLNDDQIIKLKKIYKNLIVENKNINYNKLSNRVNLNKNKILKAKNEIENEKIKTKHGTIWKQFISVEQRYRNSILDILQRYDPYYMLHIDVDTYVRGDLTELFDVIKQNDVSIRFRLDRKRNDRKVLGNIIGFSNTKNTKLFLDKWIQHIDKYDLAKKPKGYGQTSFYLAYNDMKDKIKFGSVPPKFSRGPRFENAICWAANHGNMNSKNQVLKYYWEDFKRIKNE